MLPQSVLLRVEPLGQEDKTGIGRMDLETMKSLGWEIGDIVQLGERKAAVRILPILNLTNAIRRNVSYWIIKPVQTVVFNGEMKSPFAGSSPRLRKRFRYC